MPEYQPERLMDLWAAVCRQALRDYQAGQECPNRPDAGAFLRSCGLLTEAGLRYGGLAPRNGKHMPRRTANPLETAG